MSEGQVLADAARRLFAKGDSGQGEGSKTLWTECSGLGWNLVGIGEDQGGVGGSLRDLATLVRESGRGSAAIPLIEDSSARACLAAGGHLASVNEADTLTLHVGALSKDGGGLTGVAEMVPWASQARYLVSTTDVVDGSWVLIDLADERVRVDPGTNCAGEGRDRVELDRSEPVVEWSTTALLSPQRIERRCALLRGCQLLGVLERTMELTVEHAANREQFGRAINKNQAVAHHLAIMRAGIDLASVVVEATLDAGIDDEVALAVMRSTLGSVSEDVSARAHQIHAAIGVTHEHPLRRSTMRLWAYRDENGTQRSWTLRLGRMAIEGGADALWEMTQPRLGADVPS